MDRIKLQHKIEEVGDAIVRLPQGSHTHWVRYLASYVERNRLPGWRPNRRSWYDDLIGEMAHDKANRKPVGRLP